MTTILPEHHLSQETLEHLIAGTLESQQRLEAAAHLSECSRCAAQYALLLSDDLLLEPPEPITPSVTKRLRSRARNLFANRYAAAAAAIVLAITFWSLGTFSDLVPENASTDNWFSQAGSTLSDVQAPVQDLFSDLSNHLQQFFSPGSSDWQTATAPADVPPLSNSSNKE